MNERHLEILQHAIGADKYGQGGGHREVFCAGGDDVPLCRELVAAGLMATFERAWLPYYNCRVTKAGRDYIQEHSLKPPKLTRSQRRYREFLREDSGYSFSEWLKVRHGKKEAE